MALVKCPDCGKDFSDLAAACPNCGRPHRAAAQPDRSPTPAAEKRRTGCTTIGCAVLILFAVIGVFADRKGTPSAEEQAATKASLATDNARDSVKRAEASSFS